MRALLSNDDGYLSPALGELHRICQKHFSTTRVVAPDRNCSGYSSALTLRQPIYIHHHRNGFISVEGTPSDCVSIGLSGVFDSNFDIVISGINLGLNIGKDVVYSGTVAAAIEGRFLPYPAIAVSIGSKNPKHYQTVAYILNKVFTQLKAKPLPERLILNINVPDIPLNEFKGIKITRLGDHRPNFSLQKNTHVNGEVSYSYGSTSSTTDEADDTDCFAIRNNYASITPLHLDLTEKQHLKTLTDWIDDK